MEHNSRIARLRVIAIAVEPVRVEADPVKPINVETLPVEALVVEAPRVESVPIEAVLVEALFIIYRVIVFIVVVFVVVVIASEIDARIVWIACSIQACLSVVSELVVALFVVLRPGVMRTTCANDGFKSVRRFIMVSLWQCSSRNEGNVYYSPCRQELPPSGHFLAQIKQNCALHLHVMWLH